MEENSLNWPNINADSSNLAKELRKMGYTLNHRGRSGFESRNIYDITLDDKTPTAEIIEKINQDIETAQQNIKQAQLEIVARNLNAIPGCQRHFRNRYSGRPL